MGSIILGNAILMGGSNIPKAKRSVEKNNMQTINSESKNLVPTCEELNLSQDQIDEAVAVAIVGINNPWGDEDDFQLLLDRVETKLGCTLQKLNDTTKTEDAK